jgi:hypothetical protein
MSFDNIPYVFEMARVHKGCVSDPKFSMTYDEYSKYSKMFDDVSESEKLALIEMAKKRRGCVRGD